MAPTSITLIIVIIIIIIMVMLAFLLRIVVPKTGGAASTERFNLQTIRELIFCRNFIDATTIDNYCAKIALPGTTPDQIKSFGIMELSMITKYHRDYQKLETLKKSVKNTIFDHNYRTQINKEAYAFEVVVENKLKQLTTVPFKNEQQLRAEGSNLTPDFLFSKDAPFVYNGTKVYWIDAKNYPCYDSKMTHFKLIAQNNKYTEKFGQGMFVFNGIFKDIKIGNTLICDYNTL